MKTQTRNTWTKQLRVAGLSAVAGLMLCGNGFAAAVFEEETTRTESSVSYMPAEPIVQEQRTETTYSSGVAQQPMTVERTTTVQSLEPAMPAAQPVVIEKVETRKIEEPMMYHREIKTTKIQSAEPTRVERTITTTEKERKVRPGGVTDVVGDVAAFPFHLTGGVIQAVF